MYLYIVIVVLILLFIFMTRRETFVNDSRVVTFHYTNWCPHCKNVRGVWEQIKVAAKNSGIVFEEVDEDQIKTPGVTYYPTIRMLDEYGHRSEYKGAPDFDALRAWIFAPRYAVL